MSRTRRPIHGVLFRPRCGNLVIRVCGKTRDDVPEILRERDRVSISKITGAVFSERHDISFQMAGAAGLEPATF